MRGFGGVMNVMLRGGYDAASRFVQALKLPRQAVSLGGVESLVVHAAAMWAGTMNDEQMRVAGIAPNAVRFSVGVEGVDDLQADLAQALAGGLIRSRVGTDLVWVAFEGEHRRPAPRRHPAVTTGRRLR
jgi:cystathionine beta-lyase/cystathionine gamma-synthase